MMKKIKEMIDTAFSKSEAINMLNTFKVFGNITESQYKKGRLLINKEFNKTHKI
jgi:hypothetical protein